MTDYSTKRIAIRFCTPQVIDLIEKLPRGYKSMIIESALTTYLNSEIGQRLTDQLKLRKKQLDSISKSVKPPKPHRPSKPEKEFLRNQLNGDF
ncbi:MAG: hypothetical protein COX19_14705 [Desulfobacterales bacterium CG23_combo_of_CG06-09_8_20_14_all_51_8]|nr:MAG: hypothetical protein COX19_14705 [Desulfobacterales bacterium CG23_combo_of_CG06-09_8_20_14_all_51_8]